MSHKRKPSDSDEEPAEARWTDKVEDSGATWDEWLDHERDRREKEDAAMTQEQREFDNPMLNPDFAAKAEKWREEEKKQKAKRQRQIEKEEERYRKEEARIMERNRELAEPTAGELKAAKMQEELMATVVGKAAQEREWKVNGVESARRNLAGFKRRHETASKGTYYNILYESKGYAKSLASQVKIVTMREKALADVDAEYPEAAKWMEMLKGKPLKERLAIVQAMEKKLKGDGADPVVVSPKVKKEEKTKIKTEVKEKAGETTDDATWTSLEKVFLACFVRDNPLLPSRIGSKDLYTEYAEWATECRFPKTLILSYWGGDKTFSGAIIKANLLTKYRDSKPIVWSTEKLKELPRAPETYLGRSTRRERPVLASGSAFGPAPRGRDDEEMEKRMDKLDDYFVDKLVREVSALPAPKDHKDDETDKEDKTSKSEQPPAVPEKPASSSSAAAKPAGETDDDRKEPPGSPRKPPTPEKPRRKGRDL